MKTTRAFQHGAELLAGTDSVYAGVFDFTFQRDGGAEVIPPRKLPDGQNIPVAKGRVRIHIAVESCSDCDVRVLSRKLVVVERT